MSSTFDLVTRQGGEKSVQALSVAGALAGALAGAGLRSAAASCGPAIMFTSGLASGAAAEKEETWLVWPAGLVCCEKLWDVWRKDLGGEEGCL